MTATNVANTEAIEVRLSNNEDVPGEESEGRATFLEEPTIENAPLEEQTAIEGWITTQKDL